MLLLFKPRFNSFDLVLFAVIEPLLSHSWWWALLWLPICAVSVAGERRL